MHYRERLLPRWWGLLLPLGVVAMVAIAYGAALGALAGWAVAAAGVVLVVVFTWVNATVIEVTDASLVAGSATLPLSSVGTAEVVSRGDIERLRGPGADARIFTALRPLAARDGVLITLDDPEDPHPAWLISSRNPSLLVAALPATMDPARTSEQPTNDGPPMEDG